MSREWTAVLGAGEKTVPVRIDGAVQPRRRERGDDHPATLHAATPLRQLVDKEDDRTPG